MKTKKYFFVILALISGIIYISCGEDTATPPTGNKITVTLSKFKHLDQNSEGLYEAWVSFDTAGFDHNESKFNSLGKFNISVNGSIVDSSGSPMVFKFKRPYVFDDAKDALISIEPPNDPDTLPGTHLLAGVIAVSSNSLDAVVTVEGEDAFGHRGEHFFEAGASYILNTPSSFPGDYYKGIWFCDTLQTSLFDSLFALPDTLGWKYEGWVVDTTTTPYTYASTGKFLNPDSADEDGAGQYKGPLMGYLKPGQDWILSNPYSITNLKNGKYQVWITVEPSLETATQTPFFLRLFQGYLIPVDAVRGEVIQLQNVASVYVPSAVIKVLK